MPFDPARGSDEAIARAHHRVRGLRARTMTVSNDVLPHLPREAVVAQQQRNASDSFTA